MTIEVTVLKRFRGLKENGQGQNQFISIYNYDVNTNSAVPLPPVSSSLKSLTLPYIEPVVFYFVNTAIPTILNYDTLYASRFMEFPVVSIFADVYDVDGVLIKELPMQDVPAYIFTDEILTSITWELSEALTGKIVLSRR